MIKKLFGQPRVHTERKEPATVAIVCYVLLGTIIMNVELKTREILERIRKQENIIWDDLELNPDFDEDGWTHADNRRELHQTLTLAGVLIEKITGVKLK